MARETAVWAGPFPDDPLLVAPPDSAPERAKAWIDDPSVIALIVAMVSSVSLAGSIVRFIMQFIWPISKFDSIP